MCEDADRIDKLEFRVEAIENRKTVLHMARRSVKLELALAYAIRELFKYDTMTAEKVIAMKDDAEEP